MVITSLNRPLLQKIPSWVLWIVVWINMLIDITCECDLYFYTFKCISLCCIMETAAPRNRMRAVRGGEATRTSLFTGVLHWHLGLWPAHPRRTEEKKQNSEATSETRKKTSSAAGTFWHKQFNNNQHPLLMTVAPDTTSTVEWFRWFSRSKWKWMCVGFNQRLTLKYRLIYSDH